MKLTIQNKNLSDVAEFLLNEVSASGKKNIDRMRVFNAIDEKNQEIAKEEQEMLKEYAEVDEEGGFIRDDNDRIKFKDIKGFKKAQDELLEEQFVIDDANMQSALKTTKKLAENPDKKLTGKSAQAHFILDTAFEDCDEDNNNEEDE